MKLLPTFHDVAQMNVPEFVDTGSTMAPGDKGHLENQDFRLIHRRIRVEPLGSAVTKIGDLGSATFRRNLDP